ncbi:GNAT family N-acetyltransferase [Sphingomonas sp. 2R-10]|uniref:GNAT family N-acetyltransferase n=1 Tax=Sphingomonas sp. 2R-10 TaxID=3045148 RepID=UPI000F7700FD|nr:GNAT family N-acetyltransferase [Sphingomonas sp. 2R-10]MDJ0277093.1 GNAT family N-acetyltransferase [Sphingomonas sp. 2R-10]
MIGTERLVLRPYAVGDRAAILSHVADAEVMRFLTPLPTDADVDAAIARQNGYQRDLGYCFWSVEARAGGALVGVCGLKPGAAGTPLEGSVEIGWRFGRAHWGRGFAREAAAASLAWGFDNLPDARIGAITVLANTRSWGLMERIGMVRDPDGDFDHPAVPDDSPLKRHITHWKARP